jgi:hypothetical protein
VSSETKTEIYQLFHERVLKGRKQTTYTEKKYTHIEESPSEKTHIPDVFFEMLLQDVQKTINFDNYYINLEKQRL